MKSLDRDSLMDDLPSMRAVTIKEAKAKLNELIEAAERGEDIVLLRGSQHVAAIVPITEADLELRSRLSDAQARAVWQQLAAERAAGSVVTFESAAEAAKHLAGKPPRRPARRRTAASRKR